MLVKNINYLLLFLFAFSCKEKKEAKISPAENVKDSITICPLQIPEKNQLVVAAVKQFGPEISSTYEKAVCTELVIQILEKVQDLNAADKKRIRIITGRNIQELLAKYSSLSKGVYFSLIEKGVGIPIENKNDVQEGDFVNSGQKPEDTAVS